MIRGASRSDYLGQRMEAKLDHDLSSVRLNRPDGDSQLRGDLLVSFLLPGGE